MILILDQQINRSPLPPDLDLDLRSRDQSQLDLDLDLDPVDLDLDLESRGPIFTNFSQFRPISANSLKVTGNSLKETNNLLRRADSLKLLSKLAVFHSLLFLILFCDVLQQI